MMPAQIKLDSIHRINVVGTRGSGKSTFSKRLAEILDIPHLEIDKVFWGPDWTYDSDEVFFGKLDKALSRTQWVLDGNYMRTVPVKWKNVQMVIWLDYSFPTVLFRAVKRAVWRVFSRVELWEGTGNRESFRMLFSKDSIVLWTINTYADNRAIYNSVMLDKNYQHIKFVRIGSPGEAERFLRQVSRKKTL